MQRVHATLLDSALSSYERLVAPLSAADVETYYQEMTVVAEAFGCPRSEQPADHGEFVAYWADQVRTIQVTDVGRRLGRDIIRPTLPLKLHVPLAPALALQRLVAVGTLPPPIREGFGFEWDIGRQRRLDRIHAIARRSNGLLPPSVRVAPVHLHGRLLLHQAAKHVAQFDAKMATTGRSVPGA